MSQKIKDAADLFAAEGEEAREILEGLKEQAKDALGLAVSEAPAEGDFLGRYRHFKERELPLIMRLEDPGERRAVLENIAKTHDLKVSDLRKVLSAAEKRAEEAAAQEDPWRSRSSPPHLRSGVAPETPSWGDAHASWYLPTSLQPALAPR